MTEQELNTACEAYCLVCKKRDTDCYEYCQGLPDKAKCNAITDFRKAMSNCGEIAINKLTWQDTREIVEIADQMLQTAHDRVKWEDKSEEDYYTEILKRFKKIKED